MTENKISRMLIILIYAIGGISIAPINSIISILCILCILDNRNIWKLQDKISSIERDVEYLSKYKVDLFL